MAITLNGGTNSTPASNGSDVLNKLNDGSTTVKKTSNSVLDMLNDDSSEEKSTGNFSGGTTDSSASLRDKIKETNKNVSKQTVDSTFNLSSGGSKFDDSTVFVGANNQTATLGEIKSGTSSLSVDDVWSTTPSATSAYNTDNTKQGDYQASKAESSKVETETFGKQNDIVTDPTLVTQNKGLVGNDSIESVNGLVTTQKDKEGQEVLDSKKKRDEAEADDKTQSMRDRIKAMNKNVELDEEAVDKFNLGQEAASKEKAVLAKAEKLLSVSQEKVDECETYVKEQEDNYKSLYKEENKKFNEAAAYTKAICEIEENMLEYLGFNPILNDTKAKKAGISYEEVGFVNEDGEQDTTIRFVYKGTDEKLKSWVNEHNSYLNLSIEAWTETYELKRQANDAEKLVEQAKQKLATVQKEHAEYQTAYDSAKTAYDNAFTSAEETPTAKETEGPVAEEVTQPETVEGEKEYYGVKMDTDFTLTEGANLWRDLYERTGNERYLNAAERYEAASASKKALEEATAKIADFNNASPKDIATWVESQKKYTDNLNAALNSTSAFKETNYNRNFTAAVSAANDFEVTYKAADGSIVTTTYSAFATEMATKSPQIAAAMYNSKADQLEKDGHKVLAKINRRLASMQENWFGSKVGFNDNKVRNQFNEMADLNMRATYAAYNNVLSDETGKYTDEQKATASEAIQQAKALKTASAALKASTGFFSGIGDGTSDGIYGTTTPEDLNGYQKTLNGIDNFAKIALGLGVTPTANKAYQNFYYMNKDYLDSEDGIFNKDWDKDGFAWVEEYGNNTTAQLIVAGGELTTGIVLAATGNTAGIQMIADSVLSAKKALYGIRDDAKKVAELTEEITGWFKEAEGLDGLPEEVKETLTVYLTQTEDFELKADEVENLDNWLEGSGSNTTSNEKFNQSLSYDEWLKLIESDETMRDYAKKLAAEKKEKKGKEE